MLVPGAAERALTSRRQGTVPCNGTDLCTATVQVTVPKSGTVLPCARYCTVWYCAMPRRSTTFVHPLVLSAFVETDAVAIRIQTRCFQVDTAGKSKRNSMSPALFVIRCTGKPFDFAAKLTGTRRRRRACQRRKRNGCDRSGLSSAAARSRPLPPYLIQRGHVPPTYPIPAKSRPCPPYPSEVTSPSQRAP